MDNLNEQERSLLDEYDVLLGQLSDVKVLQSSIKADPLWSFELERSFKDVISRYNEVCEKIEKSQRVKEKIGGIKKVTLPLHKVP